MARVLVVDDEPAIRTMLRAALEDAGYVVRTAPDGLSALGVAHTWRPDAIVLDLMMPAMNGWQFAEAYYQQLPGPHGAIIAVTAAGPGAVRAAEGLGVIRAVLAKPLHLGELLRAIEDAVGMDTEAFA